MSLNDQQIINAVLDLPPDRRVLIAERIYDSLTSDRQVEANCLKEAESRLSAFYNGDIATVPADEVMQEFLD